jgi:hypothetical protein
VSDALDVGEGVEISGLVGSDAEVDDAASEAVPEQLRKLSVTYSHPNQLIIINSHPVGKLSQRTQKTSKYTILQRHQIIVINLLLNICSLFFLPL